MNDDICMYCLSGEPFSTSCYSAFLLDCSFIVSLLHQTIRKSKLFLIDGEGFVN